jgi:hypothetical protein
MASITLHVIADYMGDTSNFIKLTSLLHIKSDTIIITLGNLENTYKSIFKDLNNLTLQNHDKKIFELIIEVADTICEEVTELILSLENKVVLSIAIRLRAEEYMINKIDDLEFISTLNNNQTGKLFGEFKNRFPKELKNIEVLEKVNLMTPENIHLNSFMFEPILDISDQHLKQLYKEVMQLIAIEELGQAQAQVASGEI